MLAIGLIALTTTGCGALVSMNAQSTKFDLRTTTPVDAEPDVFSPVTRSVKKIAIVDWSDLMVGQYPADNIRVYKSIVRNLELQLQNEGYKTVSAKKFRQALKASDFDLSLVNAEDYEIEEVVSAISRKVGAHAGAYIAIDTIGNHSSLSNQFSNMGKLITSGTIAIDMSMDLKLIRAKKPEVIFATTGKQVEWISGSNGTKLTKSKELNMITNREIKPLIKLLSTSVK